MAGVMDCWVLKTVSMYRIVFLINCCVILTCCSSKQKAAALPYYNSPDFTPHFINASAAAKEIDHTIADFSCNDQEGANITQKNIEGKIHVANFFFTACGSICPRMMSNLKAAYEPFKTDSDIVF